MSGFGQPFGSGGFGQQQPFGSTAAASPFGATPAFGQQPGQQASPFGASSSTGLFGASQPAFVAASTPAFGAAATGGMFGGGNAFGARPGGGFSFGGGATGAFGASQPAFGAASTPAFGASSTPAFGFGAASTPAFGAASTPAFGAPAAAPFGASTPAFGASTAPGFGASSTPAFGAASTPAFGGFGATSSPAFGAAASTPAFGAAPTSGAFGAPFGAAPQAAVGTRVAPYAKHQDKDQSSSATGATANVYYATITAMPVYQSKSTEELRAEDYAAGVKSATSAPAPAASPGLGASAPAFGSFGSTAPAFGAATPAVSSSPFGTPAQGAFGTPAFGTPAASTPAFGAASTPSLFGSNATTAFGTPASTPAFGGFGASTPASTPAFGAQPVQGAGLFGSTGGAFGGFGASSTPAFGSTGAFGQPAASTPAPSFSGLGAPASGGLFGQQPAASSPFGTPAPGLFGTPAASAPAPSPFGSTPLFGGQQQQQSSSAFGGFGTGAFGARPASSAAFGGFATTGSLFGPSSTPASGGLFASSPAAASAFSFSPAPQSGASLFAQSAPTPGFGFGGSLFGGASQAASQPQGSFLSFSPAPGQLSFGGQQQQQQQQQGTPAGVGQQPYGAFPQLPAVSVPEPKIGIGARPARAAITTPRPSPLLTLRSHSTPRAGVTGAARGPGSAGGSAGRTSSPLGLAAAADGPGSASLLLPARDNPHKLFIREPPPSTEAAPTSSLTPTHSRARTATAATPAPASAAGPSTSRAPVPRGMAENGTGRREDNASAPAANGVPAGKKSPATANGTANGHKRDGADERIEPGLLPRLGRLASDGYFTEPSMEQLRSMASEDPGQLQSLEDFAVGRRNMGRVKWLNPVDVRGVDLADIVTIGQDEVAVYPDGCTTPKPPAGTGLNSAAEVTLYNVHKRDSATGEPIKDAKVAQQFERKLRRYCASVNTKFVFYKPDGGVWRFEVEHFSRYGVPSSSDDEDEDLNPSSAGGSSDSEAARGPTDGGGPSKDGGPRADGEQGQPGQGKAQVGRQQRQQQQQERQQGSARIGQGTEEEGPEPMEDDAGEHHQQQQQQQGRQHQPQHGAGASRDASLHGIASRIGHLPRTQRSAERTRPRPAAEPETLPVEEPLQHALPARLGVRPQQLLHMRESLFGDGPPEAANLQGAQGGAFFRGAPGAAMPAAPGAAALLASQRQTAEGVSYGAASAVGAQHSWHRSMVAPLSLGVQEAERQLGNVSMVGGEPSSSAALVIAGAAGSPGFAGAAPAESSMPLGAAACKGQPRCVTDAALLLGRSFRGGFGPGGVLVTPSNDGRLTIRRVSPLATAAGDPVSQEQSQQERQRQQRRATEAAQRQVLAALRVHLARSHPVAAGGDDGAAGAPQWALRCRRRQLAEHVSQQLGAQGEGEEQEHRRETWKLVQVLWEFIEGEQDDEEQEEDAADGMAGVPTRRISNATRSMSGGDAAGSGDGMDADDADMRSDDMQQGEGGERDVAGSLGGSVAGKAALAQFKRRGALSAWLQRQIKKAAGAAAAAAAAGAAGASAMGLVAQLMAARQLPAAAALAAALGDARLSVLVAQAGTGVAATQDVLQQLQVWQRASVLPRHISMGRQLVLQLLAGHVEEVVGKLDLDWRRAFGLYLWYGSPPTHPFAKALAAYSAVLGSHAIGAPVPLPPYAANAPVAAAAATDTQFELLRLAAGFSRCGGEEAAAHLLRTSGYSPHPLDYSLGWQLASTLLAVDVLSPTDTAGDCLLVLARLTASHMEQVQLLELPPQWAVYIALHLAEPEGWEGLRTQVVRELLCRSAPYWADNDEARAFLGEGSLKLPTEWLEEAQALWAAQRGRHTAQLRHLLAARQWLPAHTLFAQTVAPVLFLAATRANGTPGSTPTAMAAAQQLAEAAAKLAAHKDDIPDWGVAGGLYHAWACLGAGILADLADGQQQQTEGRIGRAEALLQQVAVASTATGTAAGAAGAPSAWGAHVSHDHLQGGLMQRKLVLARMACAAQQLLQQRPAGPGVNAVLLGAKQQVTPAPLLCGVAAMLGAQTGLEQAALV